MTGHKDQPFSRSLQVLQCPTQEIFHFLSLISVWLKVKFRTWYNLSGTEYKTRNVKRRSKKWDGEEQKKKTKDILVLVSRLEKEEVTPNNRAEDMT